MRVIGIWLAFQIFLSLGGITRLTQDVFTKEVNFSLDGLLK